MKIVFIFLVLSLANTIQAAGNKKNFKQQPYLAKYFKKAEGKSNIHTMRNIDFIYMINLDQRPEKFARSSEQLAPYGIFPFRFSAVNGWELSLETVNKLGVKYKPWMGNSLWGTSYLPDKNWEPHHEIMRVKNRNYFCHCMARGTIGIVLSHLSIYYDALESKYTRIWVTEDDIAVIKNPHEISVLIDKLNTLVGKDGWDILFTDRDTKDRNGNYVPCLSYAKRPNFSPANPNRFSQQTKISADFTKINARYGAYSMVVQKSGMEKILKFFNRYRIFLPFDMDFNMPDDIRLFAVTDDVVSTQPQAESDNGAPGYLNKNTQQ